MSDEDDYYYVSDNDNDDDGDFGGDSDEDLVPPEEEDDIDSIEREYAILSREDLIKRQQSEIVQVCGVLEVGAPFARLLLTHWKWNIEVLLSKFLDKGRKHVYQESGITEGEQLALTSSFTCPSCFDEFKGEETTALSCGHRFCNDCWQTYITMKIKDGESARVKCMGSKCNNLFDESLISSFVDSSTLSKYNNFLVESYVVDSTRRRWCPSVPHCGNAAEVHFGTSVDVKCKCGTSFCFKCSNPPHNPCTCDMMIKWDKKCKDDSETSNWLNSNTKVCPKCSKTIEKDGGCNLVTCKCGQYFCWLCGESTGAAHTWTTIDGHTCGKYKDGDHDAARRSLQRRFKAHQDSLSKEMKLGTQQALEATMEALRKCTTYSYGQSEISWIGKATAQLFESRRVLGNSYVFAFYVFGEDFVPTEPEEDPPNKQNPLQQKVPKTTATTKPKQPTPAKKPSAKKNLFEDHQQQLEFTTERLSSFLETPVLNMDMALLQNIANYCGLAEKRCRGLQDIIQNEFGMDVSAPKPPEPVIKEKPKPQPQPETKQTKGKNAKINNANNNKAVNNINNANINNANINNAKINNANINNANKNLNNAEVKRPIGVLGDKKEVIDVDAQDEDEEGEGDGRQKRMKWGIGPGYDEEAALQEALKKSSTHSASNFDGEDEDLKEALRRSMLESTIREKDTSLHRLPSNNNNNYSSKNTTTSSSHSNPGMDEDEDFKLALQLSMGQK